MGKERGLKKAVKAWGRIFQIYFASHFTFSGVKLSVFSPPFAPLVFPVLSSRTFSFLFMFLAIIVEHFQCCHVFTSPCFVRLGHQPLLRKDLPRSKLLRLRRDDAWAAQRKRTGGLRAGGIETEQGASEKCKTSSSFEEIFGNVKLVFVENLQSVPFLKIVH